MDESHPPEGGMLTTLTRLFKTLREVGTNRIELFLLEVQEERVRMFDALFLLAAGILCVLMTLILLTLTVVVVFWDTHRLLVLALVTAAYAAGAVAALVKLRSQLQRWQAFSATLEQLKKDGECFKNQN